MPRGGRRPHAGRKQGSKDKRTLEKLSALDYLRKRVEADLAPIVTAEIEVAQGLFQFLAVTPLGLQVVTDPAIMQKCIASGDTFYRVVRKDPDVRAIKDLLDRTVGRPAEQVAVTGTGTLTISWGLPSTS